MRTLHAQQFFCSGKGERMSQVFVQEIWIENILCTAHKGAAVKNLYLKLGCNYGQWSIIHPYHRGATKACCAQDPSSIHCHDSTYPLVSYTWASLQGPDWPHKSPPDPQPPISNLTLKPKSSSTMKDKQQEQQQHISVAIMWQKSGHVACKSNIDFTWKKLCLQSFPFRHIAKLDQALPSMIHTSISDTFPVSITIHLKHIAGIPA
ncbi:uncharacterized protein [Narcine bancroftii]|uniref:uncharacterized protein n=1 Tax=Narcine bancroftii TaxID=1343680 RepID=UPI0038310C56